MSEPTEIPDGIYIVFKDDEGWHVYLLDNPRESGEGNSLREAVDNLIERIRRR